MVDIKKPMRAKVFDANTEWNESNCIEVDVQCIILPHLPYTKQTEITYNGGRSQAFELLPQTDI